MARDSTWAAAIQVAGLGVGIVTSMALARVLSEKVLGTWFVVLGVSTVLSSVSELGVPTYIVRAVAADPGSRRTVKVAFLAVGLGAGALLLVAGSPIGDWAGSQAMGPAASFVLLSAALAGARALERLGAEVLRGQGQIRAALLGNQFASRVGFLVALGPLYLVSQPLDVSVVGYALLSMLVAAMLLNYWWLRRRLRRESEGRRRRELPALLWRCLPLLANRLANTVIAGGDLVIVGAVVGASASAEYGVALRLAALVALPLAAVNAVAPHRVAALVDSDRRPRLQWWLTSSSRLAGAAAVSCTLLIVLFGDRVLGWLFGADYADAQAVAVALSLGQAVNALVGPAGLTLVNAGYRRLVAVNTVAFGLAMIAGCIYVANRVGDPLTVAMVAASAMALENLSAWWLVRNRTGLRTDAFARRAPTQAVPNRTSQA